MEWGIDLYEYVYEQIQYRIYSGEYRRGDMFPAISELVSRYNIGANTIKKAYRSLQAEGLVSTFGKGGTVVQAGAEELYLDRRYHGFLAEHTDMIFEIVSLAQHFVPAAAVLGSRRASAEDLSAMAEWLRMAREKENPFEAVNALEHFTERMLQPLQNGLLMYYSKTVSSILKIINPYVIERGCFIPELKDRVMRLYQDIYAGFETGDEEHLYCLLFQFYGMLKERLEPLLANLPVKAERQREYQWLPDSRMTKQYQMVAFDLISRISEGSILCGEYLPPEGELQKYYQTSLTTVRKALEILQLLNIVDKQNGRGSVVKPLVMPRGKKKFQSEADKYLQNRFFEAKQMLLIIAEYAAQLAAPGITGGDISRILAKMNRLKGVCEGLRYIPAMELTSLIADRCPIKAVHTMLCCLKIFFYLSLRLDKINQPVFNRFTALNYEGTHNALQLLVDGEYRRFSRAYAELIRDMTLNLREIYDTELLLELMPEGGFCGAAVCQAPVL